MVQNHNIYQYCTFNCSVYLVVLCQQNLLLLSNFYMALKALIYFWAKFADRIKYYDNATQTLGSKNSKYRYRLFI